MKNKSFVACITIHVYTHILAQTGTHSHPNSLKQKQSSYGISGNKYSLPTSYCLHLRKYMDVKPCIYLQDMSIRFQTSHVTLDTKRGGRAKTEGPTTALQDSLPCGGQLKPLALCGRSE